MNKIFTFLLVISTISLSAQSISGKAFYKTKTTTGTDYSEMPEEKRTRLEKRDKELYEKTYILTFKNKESIYKEEESLDGNSNRYNAGYLAATGSYFSDGIYKNIESDTIIEQREFLGKLFLVEDSLPKFYWKLENESKQIGNYTVFKATAIQHVDPNDYRMVNAKDDNKDVSLIVTAWYTPQIPVNMGPGIYYGLPGLILELNIYRTTFLCSKIILNTKQSPEIKKLKNGQRVSMNEFDQIVEKRREENRQDFLKN